MEKMLLKYRSWYKGEAPRQIRLQIPGWSGEPNEHKDGDVPQPWHCTPFVEGSTYGIELLYSFDTECTVKMVDGEIQFVGDFSGEDLPESVVPPFSNFAPGHFGMTSCLDIEVPEGYVIRIEPHPRYYTDETYTVPLAIPGHLNTSMWPRIFFVVFKNPMPGQTYVFRKGEPYAQLIILPRKMLYEIRPMSAGESTARALLEDNIEKYHKKFVQNSWHDHKNNNFDDKYKLLNQIFIRHGKIGFQKFLQELPNNCIKKCGMTKKKLFFPKGKNEIIQDKEKK